MAAPDPPPPSVHASRHARHSVIVVFAKAPRAGLVKTRLSPPLTSEQAAKLYSHMLDDVLVATAGFAEVLELSAVIAVHPPDACREIALLAPRCFRVVAQRGNDLSERMAWAVAEAAAAGASNILLRSSDSPLLSHAAVEEAVASLDEFDISICPDLDGGYGLIALRRPAPGLFDHPMSTRSVLDDTLANAQRLGLRAHLLEPSPDVDTAEDLLELRRRRSSPAAELCPRTLQFLDQQELWPHGSNP